MKRWLGLMTAWQGGTSPAQVAVAVHPNAFLMQHPLATGGEYDKRVRTLMLALTGAMDVDGVVLGSRHAIDPAHLARYSLVIIPEDMGRGLAPAMVDSLRQYVGRGGNLLLLGSALTSARPDLTGESDLTREFAGLTLTGACLPGYVTIAPGEFAPAPPPRFWAPSRRDVRLEGARVLVTDDGGAPLLLVNGRVHFSTIGFSTEAAAYFANVAHRIAHPAVTIRSDGGVRILEGVVKKGALCLPLWGQGRATIAIDPARVPLPPAARYQAKDIVTGDVLGEFDARGLSAGLPVRIPHLYQPFLLTVGAPAALERYPGLYPSADVFAGLTPKAAADNPEVPAEAAPSTPRRVEVALVDHAARFETPVTRSVQARRDSCRDALRALGFEPELVDVDIFLEPNKARRDGFKRIVIPSGADWYSQVMFDGIDDYVRAGGLLISNSSLVLLDRNANHRADEGDGTCDFAMKRFLGVHGHASSSMPRIRVLRGCPLTRGLTEGEWIALDPPATGRETRNASAEVVVGCVRLKKDRPDAEQPFLTYKHQGRGAAIYLVGQIDRGADKVIGQLLRNCCAEETLRWLCR